MFWKKNKKESPEIKDICNLDKGLSECLSVANLRLYQQQLEQIQTINLDDVIKKYFDIECLSPEFKTYIPDYDSNIFKIVRYMSYKHKINNYEEHFKEFGKEIDLYHNRNKQIEELTSKIKQEKEKLGIK